MKALNQAGETPRTDALHRKLVKLSENPRTWVAGKDYVEMREHAETLERELQAANERADSERRLADHARGRVTELAKEIDSLRAQLAAQPQAVEAATIERCKQAVASWKIEADSLTISERAYNDVLDDAIRAIEALASQPQADEAVGLPGCTRKRFECAYPICGNDCRHRPDSTSARPTGLCERTLEAAAKIAEGYNPACARFIRALRNKAGQQ